jgi:hypothetical protein
VLAVDVPAVRDGDPSATALDCQPAVNVIGADPELVVGMSVNDIRRLLGPAQADGSLGGPSPPGQLHREPPPVA